MHDALITMKDGSVKCGPIWTWMPKEGYLVLAGEDYGTIFLKDVVSAVNKGQRTGPGIVEDVDLLERARKEGWDGS